MSSFCILCSETLREVSGINIESINLVPKIGAVAQEKEQPQLPDSKQIDVQQQNQKEKPEKQQKLAEALSQINQTMETFHTELRFTTHEASGETIVKVVKSETGEVIREIPPEYVLKIVAYVKEMLGLLLDKLV